MKLIDKESGEEYEVVANPHLESCIAAGVDPEKASQILAELFNYKLGSNLNYEKSHLYPSEAVPDQGWTIQELMKRHAAGLMTDLDIQREGTYTQSDDEEEFDIPDMEKMKDADLNEQKEYIRKIKEYAYGFEQEISRAEKAKAAEKAAKKKADKANGPSGPLPSGSKGGDMGGAK